MTRAGRRVEGGGELGALRARLQLALLEAVADEERERVEQDRLAGAGLAGEDGEAAVELEIERFDDDEIPDRQKPKHQVRRGRDADARLP